MSRLPRHIQITMGLMILLGAGFAWLAYQTSQVGRTRASLEILGQAAPFTLTDQTGSTFNSAQLEGHVWIADFIFSRCMGPCPLMSAKMAKLQETFASEPGVRLISFSVDPVADTAPVLEAYARRFKANPAQWTFLTGDVMALYRLVYEGFKLPVGATPPPDRVLSGELITHTTRFVLVDRKGAIRGYFDSNDEDFLPRITAAVKALI